MTTRMLIDARHREETRVAVVKGNRIEEFDFESAERKQLKGNIYLAKVTRVEPSLQAAFVDYGGNRHGFLAFSEIHPDYYQIPKEDREALLREEAEHAAEEEALRAAGWMPRTSSTTTSMARRSTASSRTPNRSSGSRTMARPIPRISAETRAPPVAAAASAAPPTTRSTSLRERRTNLRHRYKIQDVIRRRQVLLVQVVKEERGNKGAALTTYLSLAGRYCVLMPNTSHGGGISRKISNAGDRKRLKSIMADLKLPRRWAASCAPPACSAPRPRSSATSIIWPACGTGSARTRLPPSAPALVYGDSDLLKRAIRDIYNRDIDEVIVEGEQGYRPARRTS